MRTINFSAVVVLALSCASGEASEAVGESRTIWTTYSILESPGFFPSLAFGFQARPRGALTVHVATVWSVSRDSDGSDRLRANDPATWEVPVDECIPVLMSSCLAGEYGMFTEIAATLEKADLRLTVNVREFRGEISELPVEFPDARSNAGTGAERYAHGRCRLLVTLVDAGNAVLISQEYFAERSNRYPIQTDALRNPCLALRACLLDVLRDIDRLFD